MILIPSDISHNDPAQKKLRRFFIEIPYKSQGLLVLTRTPSALSLLF
jgi:hypothetical protein